MTTRNKLLWGLAGVVVLVALGTAALRVAVNPEVFKPQIEDLVHRATGLTLRIEGPIRLSYFPWLGIELGQASLGGLAGFEKEPFVSLEGAVIRLRLAALVHGNLEAGALRLKSPSLTLIRAADGRTNWQALPIRQVSLENDRVVVRSDAGQTSFRYLLEGFAIQNGAVTFEDRAAGRTVRLTDLSAKADRIASGETGGIDVAFKLATDNPKVSVATALTGKLTVDPANLVFSFDKADLKLAAEAANLPFAKLDGTGSADVTVRGNDGRIQIRNLALAATAAGGIFPDKGETAKLAGSLDYDATAGKLAFSDMRLDAMGLQLTGRLDGDLGKEQSGPTFVWRYATNSFNPKALLASFGLTVSGLPDTALTTLETRGEVDFSPSALGLKVESLRLDGQNIAFSAQVTDFKQPAVRFALSAESLDADRYLAVAKSAEAGKDKAPAPKTPAAPNPLLRTARIDGTVNLGKLTLRGLSFNKVNITVAGAGGILAVKPFSLEVAGGSVAGGISADVNQAVPAVKLAATVSGVQAGQLLTALKGSAPVSGVFSAKADVAGAGATAEALLGSLGGTASFRLDNGKVEGFSVSPQLLSSLKAIGGLTDLNPQAVLNGVAGFSQGLASSHQGSTMINVASASFLLTKGVGSSRDILVRSPVGTVSGGGTVDLGHKQLNLALKAEVTGVATVPLLVQGPMADPKVSVDADALTKEAISAVPKAIGKSIQQGGQKVLDAVKGLFGN